MRLQTCYAPDVVTFGRPFLELRRPSPILTDLTETSRRRELANKIMDFSSCAGKLLADDDTDVLREGEGGPAQA